jgi:hypothetical protein
MMNEDMTDDGRTPSTGNSSDLAYADMSKLSSALSEGELQPPIILIHGNPK